MTKKIIMGVLGASILMGLAVPAHAQNDRGRGANQQAPDSYSQEAGRGNQNAQSNQRGQDFDNNRRGAKTLTFNTRFRATIFLTEDVVRSRRGSKNVCTISVRGPQARLVPKQRLRNIARDNCSRRANVRFNVQKFRR